MYTRTDYVKLFIDLESKMNQLSAYLCQVDYSTFRSILALSVSATTHSPKEPYNV